MDLFLVLFVMVLGLYLISIDFKIRGYSDQHNRLWDQYKNALAALTDRAKAAENANASAYAAEKAAQSAKDAIEAVKATLAARDEEVRFLRSLVDQGAATKAAVLGKPMAPQEYQPYPHRSPLRSSSTLPAPIALVSDVSTQKTDSTES